MRQRGSDPRGWVMMNAEVINPNLSGEERWKSISDLRKLGPSAVEYLIINLWDEDRMVRLAAVDALGEIGDVRAFEHLESMLDDPDSDVRFACVVALGNLGDKRAVGTLARACHDSNGFVRTMAREMMKKLELSEKS
jgi:HEAT repeat protein